MSKRIIICDIDGTLADINHRLHCLQREPKDWDAFESMQKLDTPHHDMITILQALQDKFLIFLCSGRNESAREGTDAWCVSHQVPYDYLFLRKNGDHRPDHVIKQEMLAEILEKGYQPFCVFEDRDQVVQMWRSNGLRCYQVANGKF